MGHSMFFWWCFDFSPVFLLSVFVVVVSLGMRVVVVVPQGKMRQAEKWDSVLAVIIGNVLAGMD